MGWSEKRILGWEPIERHEYQYDSVGRVAAVTVTRDVEWDDDSREDMLALAQYEAGICACGFHSSLTHDTANLFKFENDVCPVCAGADRHMRWQMAEDDKVTDALGENPSPLAPRPDDGRRVLARLLSDAEAATAKQASQPPRSA